MRTALHIHTENSLKECGLKIDDVLKRLQSLGFGKAVLGDACNMTGAVEFCSKAKKYGITPVLGVECLLKEKEGISKILLSAKGQEGYVSLCRLVTEANANLSADGKPVLEVSQLGGHAGLLACCGGTDSYVAYPYARNQEYRRLAQTAPLPKELEGDGELEGRLKEVQDALKAKREERKRLQAGIKKRDAAIALNGGGLPDGGLEDALRKTQNEIARFSRMEKSIKKQLDASRKETEKAKEAEEAAKKIQAQVLSQEGVYGEIRGRLSRLQKIFGEGLAVGVTAHGGREEAETNRLLLRCAAELKVTPVLALDSYTLDGSEGEVLKWHLAQSLQENKWVPIQATSGNYGIEQVDGLLKRAPGAFPEGMVATLAANTDAFFAQCSITQNTRCRKG